MKDSVVIGAGEPLVHLPRGTIVDHYRLQKYLGHGHEATAYLAEEQRTGVRRVVKLFRCRGPNTLAYVRLIALSLERLSSTRAVVPYHHIGQWFSRVGEPFAYIVADYLDGPRLVDQLKRRWSEKRALDLIYALCGNVALAHHQGIAIGDFEDGNNVILVGGREPVFCDIGLGPGLKLNRDFRADIDAFGTIVTQLSRQCRFNDDLQMIDRAFIEVQAGRITRSTMADILHWLTDL